MDIFEDIELLTAIGSLFTAFCALIITFFSFRVSRSTLIQSQQSAYLNFYKLVEKHHSKEITDLRRIGYQIKEKCEVAKSEQKNLQQLDSEFHSKVSALTNYYESVGMYL